MGVTLDFAEGTKLCMANEGRVTQEDRTPAEVLAQVKARHKGRMAEAGPYFGCGR